MSTLHQVISALEALPPAMVFPQGFSRPNSYRGYYDQLAFAPAENTLAGTMLSEARFALGHTFTGYKGGEYKMDEWTDCWLAEWGDTGDALNIDALVSLAKLKHVHNDLLSAAKELKAALDMIPDEDWYKLDITREASDAIAIGYDALRDAISKAEGQS